MKKLIFFFLAICLIFTCTANAQKSAERPIQPEPACACNTGELVMDMGGKLKLDYKELSISVLDDGRILAKNRAGDDYYIVKDGVTQGPYKSGDPKIADFEATDKDDNSIESLLLKNKPYISRSGEKLLITFGGKTYGPFGKIEKFTVTKSKEKFAALVVENVLTSEDQTKKLDEAMKNAKNDQERMDLSIL